MLESSSRFLVSMGVTVHKMIGQAYGSLVHRLPSGCFSWVKSKFEQHGRRLRSGLVPIFLAT
jgi:hypothetical protein